MSETRQVGERWQAIDYPTRWHLDGEVCEVDYDHPYIVDMIMCVCGEATRIADFCTQCGRPQALIPAILP